MPKPQQKWSQENLMLALEACKVDGISMRKVATTYGIPRATLYDKLTGRRQIEQMPSTVMTEEEEDEIVKWLRDMSSRGFGRSKIDLMSTVKNYLDFKGGKTRWADNKPGEMWYRLFKKRHPDLTFRKPQKLGKARALVTADMLQNWFKNFQATITAIDAGILLDPARIFNADETGFHLDAQSGNVLAFIGDKYVYQVSQETRTMITALICSSASGFFPHPLLIYPPTQFRGFAPTDMFSECLVAKSPNGWINIDLFSDWLEKIFIPQTAHIKKPILLLVDGHRSHQSLRASELCSKNGIILYALLAHASHIIQPLDVGVFSTLKANWKDVVHHRAETEVVTKRSFANAFKDAYEKVVANKTATYQAFRKSGIFPIDFHAIDKSKLISTSTLESPPTSFQLNSPEPSQANQVSLSSPTQALPVPDETSPQLPSTTMPQPTSLLMPSLSSSTAQPTPSSSSLSVGDPLRKLLMLTSQIGEQETLLFLQCLDEGYDLIGVDKTYDLWKQYHLDVSKGTSSWGPIQERPHPLSIPTINRGQKRRQTDKMPDLISGEKFISRLKEKNAAEKEEAERKLRRKKELEEKKKMAVELEEEKQKMKEKKKQEAEMRKKECEARKASLQEEKRQKKEQALKECEAKKATLEEKRKLKKEKALEEFKARKARIQEERRKRKEKALEEKKEKGISKKKYQEETALSTTDEDMSESEMLLESDTMSLSIDDILELDRVIEHDEESGSEIVMEDRCRTDEKSREEQGDEMQTLDDDDDDLSLLVVTQRKKMSCVVCANDEKEVNWIECTKCLSWYHYCCVKIISLNEMTCSDIEKLDFICDLCQ